MKKIIVIFIGVLALMEGVSWWVYTSLSSKDNDESSQSGEETPVSTITSDTSSQQPSEKSENSSSSSDQASVVPETPSVSLPPKETVSDFSNFPPPSTEVVNGRTERTIHMGVRQYVWEPATITAKKGELVRLIIHNADVLHGIVIPDLGVMEGDIPPDGVVIEFMASKAGTFEFFCSVWCGEGHMEMRGKIVIQ
jgi:cytochrome c oxidase subunit 2